MRIFYRTSPWYTADRKTRRKWNTGYGLLCVAICCKQPPPPPPPCAPFHLPAAMFIMPRGTRESPPSHPYPFGQFWGCSGRSRGQPLIRRSWVWQLILDSNSDLMHFFGVVIGHLWAELGTAVIWQELGEFQAEAWLLTVVWIWAISWHGGPVKIAGTVRERVRP